MTTSAIVLAGGLGTRLRSVVADMPKPMAPINGTPFLTYVLDYLESFNITQVVLSVGFKYEIILAHFGYQYKGMRLNYSIEHQPLGTGGAILKGTDLIPEDSFFVLNGDSLFKADLSKMTQFAANHKATVALALKEMQNFDRYGIVETNSQHKVTAFKEKQAANHGYINGGVYWLHKSAFQIASFPNRFSFEKDFLEKYTQDLAMFACPQEGYFIDIGIPSDFNKAQQELKLI